jgi:hypothetical protein
MRSRPSLESRLARVEHALVILSEEITAIRRELGHQTPSTRSAERGSSPGPLGETATSDVRSRLRTALTSRVSSAHELERLIGSYGMLVIAALAAVAAVGTFLSWAITRGYLSLGPGARVGIGLAFAGVIGVWGFRLRTRERSFGSSLLGLGLVIVHVCAYAGGPSFGLVPTWVAFLGAATASWALALFAHAENDEPLWCVGFGGAAVAPFVTSNGHGSLYALLGYGTLVLLSACFAINRRDWPVAWRVFYGASAPFALAAGWQARVEQTLNFIAALAFPFAIAIAGISPLAVPTRKRGALRWLAMLAVIAAVMRQSSTGNLTWLEPSALVAAGLVTLLLIDHAIDVPQSTILGLRRVDAVSLDWIDAAGIPVAFTIAAIASLHIRASAATCSIAMSAMLAMFASRRRVGSARDAAAFAAIALGMVAVPLLPLEVPTGRIVGFVVIGLAAMVMHTVSPSRSWLRGGAGAFLLAALLVVTALTDAVGYRQSPFLTEASGDAAILLAAMIIVTRSWRRIWRATRAAILGVPTANDIRSMRAVILIVVTAPWIWAFLWILIELALAFSASASTLLLVTYFAATAVGCVGVGRVRGSARLRQVGLGLALASAGTAVYGARAYFDSGARIAAYLVTSAFLLGIAYWYRRPGAAPNLA